MSDIEEKTNEDEFEFDLDDDVRGEVEDTKTEVDNEVDNDKDSDDKQVDDKKDEGGQKTSEDTEEHSKKADEEPPVEEEPTPPAVLTRDDFKSLLNELRTEERASTKQLDAVKSDIESRYYPNGISRVMVDEKTGLAIRTAQDVLDLADNPDLTIEQAESWRLAKQSEWDANVREIEDKIRNIAEQTVALETGTINVMNRYEELFKAAPQLERKLMAQYFKTVSVDKNTNTILSAPVDIEEFFDIALEPYQTAFEAQKQATTTQQQTTTTPPIQKPSKDDRLDEFGDGAGGSDDDDPDDFEAQLKKEFGRE